MCDHSCSLSALALAHTQDLAAGEEALISYVGDVPSKSNAALLKDYGFVLPGNEHDRVEFEGA